MKQPKIFLVSLTGFVALAILGSLIPAGTAHIEAEARADDDESALLAPTLEQSKTATKILALLKRDHYRKLEIDDSFSRELLDRFLDDIDPTRSYFLKSDIVEFEAYRDKLDDSLKKGDLRPAFAIYNRLRERQTGRLRYLIGKLETDIDKLDFEVDESLTLDREDAPRNETVADANRYWDRLFKYDVLNLRLAGKPTEEIKEVLARRYRARLHRIEQINSRDAFIRYMSSISRTFDPHTEYFAPRDAENFDIQMSLSYEGIGALLQNEDEYTKISRIIAGGPAEKGGELEPSDRIIGVAQGVDGEMVDIVGWRLDEVVELIRGPKESIVRLNVLPADQNDVEQAKVIQITRGTVKLEEQAARKSIIELDREGANGKFKVGVIKLPAFYIDFQAARAGLKDFKSSSRDVERLIEELKKEKIDALVVDLRGNEGGSLREVERFTGLFIKTGPVVQVRDARRRVQPLEDDDPKVAYDGPLAVIVNRLSASASEIFAAAIQDYGRGIIVGSRTFGKGTVQNVAPVTMGQLKLTQAKFYRITGMSTQREGVVPDIEFPSRYDHDQIGESTYDNALPFDRIRGERHGASGVVARLIGKLRVLHEGRVKRDPEFVFIRESLDFMKERRNAATVSLREEDRKRERVALEARQIEILNRRRVAKGLDPVASLADASDGDGGRSEEADPYITETANILADFVFHKKRRFVRR